MSLNSSLFTSDSADWWTPDHILDAVYDILGEVELDPCSNLGEPNVKAGLHWGPDQGDSLAKDWHAATIYMNPPYGDEIARWMHKLAQAFAQNKVGEAIALVPARTDTQWWSDVCPLFAQVCFLKGRLKFKRPPGYVAPVVLGKNGKPKKPADTAPFPSALVYMGTRPRFAERLHALGHVMEAARRPAQGVCHATV